MKKNQIALPPLLYAALREEAARLELDVDLLVAGLVKNFLGKQAGTVQKREDSAGFYAVAATASGFGNFLETPPDYPPATEPGTKRQHEQRRHARLRVDCSAMLLFKDEDGRSARYNSAGLKDVAAGGVLLEYGKNPHIDSRIAQGKQFELIFQLYDNEPPVHMQCEICRVSKDKEQTSLGVFFVGPDKKLNAEVIRTLAGRAGSKSEVKSKP